MHARSLFSTFNNGVNVKDNPTHKELGNVFFLQKFRLNVSDILWYRRLFKYLKANKTSASIVSAVSDELQLLVIICYRAL